MRDITHPEDSGCEKTRPLVNAATDAVPNKNIRRNHQLIAMCIGSRRIA